MHKKRCGFDEYPKKWDTSNRKHQCKQTIQQPKGDQEEKNHFRFYWAPGKTNYADYWTAAAHHKSMWSMFLTQRQQALCCEGVLTEASDEDRRLRTMPDA
eukprot:scaffold3895_cov97-Alexandrium_tamarense.AAC.8